MWYHVEQMNFERRESTVPKELHNALKALIISLGTSPE